MKRAWKPLAVLAALGLIGLLYLKIGLRGEVSGADARKMVAAGARLVDVRSAAEFSDGHLPNATNMPLGDLARRSSELGAPETPIVVYCHTGMRSARAATLLRRRGFTNVVNLGAMSTW